MSNTLRDLHVVLAGLYQHPFEARCPWPNRRCDDCSLSTYGYTCRHMLDSWSVKACAHILTSLKAISVTVRRLRCKHMLDTEMRNEHQI